MDVVQEYVDYIQEGVENSDPQVLGILAAVVVGILTLLLLLICRRGSRGSGVLLLGLCDSGKTLMFSRLVHKKYTASHTSIKENVGTYITQIKGGKAVQVIDLPGHERVRTVFLEQHKGNACAIIFVIDSLTLQKELKDVADFLYTILTDRVVSRNLPPILIACNKQDVTLAKGVKVIQANLEKEINLLRVTKSAALQGTDNASNNNSFLGKRGKDFQFADLKPFKVEFAECSARGKSESGEANLGAVEKWLQQVA